MPREPSLDSLRPHEIFASADWFDPWLAGFGGDAGGIFSATPGAGLIAWHADRLAVGPLAVSIAAGASNDHTPRYDAMGPIRNPSAVFADMMRSLDVAALRFDFVPPESHLGDALDHGEGAWHFRDFCEDSPRVDCAASWDAWWQSRGSTRNLWARRERKLMKDMGARFEILDDWSVIEPALETAFAIEASGWKGREGSAIANDIGTETFYRGVARNLARRGVLRLFLLRVEDRPIAFQFTVLHGGVLNQLKVGYDEAWAKWSPGQVLQLQLLRWAFEHPGIAAYDMLGGGGRAAPNKWKWANGSERLETIWVFRRSPAGLLVWMRVVLAPRMKRLLQRWFRRSVQSRSSADSAPLPGDD